MGETAQVNTVEAPIVTSTEKAPSAHDILVDTTEREVYKGDPLFSEENFSEAQLKGEEDAPKSPEETAKESEGTKPQGEKTAAAPATGVKTEDKKAGAPVEQHEEVKPPAGFTPIAALHEERARRKQSFEQVASLQNMNTQLSDQINHLTKRIAELSDGNDGDAGGEFKLLSAKEFQDLKTDDPASALDYLYKKQEFEKQQETQRATESRISAIVEESHDIVKSIVPQVYDAKSGYGAELSSLAIENGLPNDYMAHLTSPDTLILPPGAKTPIPLGAAAAGLVIMLHNLNVAIKNGNPEKIKQQVSEQVKKETTQELMKKIKHEGAGGFKSLDSLPKSGDDSQDTFMPLSEAQIKSMKGEELRSFLGG